MMADTNEDEHMFNKGIDEVSSHYNIFVFLQGLVLLFVFLVQAICIPEKIQFVQPSSQLDISEPVSYNTYYLQTYTDSSIRIVWKFNRLEQPRLGLASYLATYF